MRITHGFSRALFSASFVLGLSLNLTGCTSSSSGKTTTLNLSLPDPKVAFPAKTTSAKVGASSVTLTQQTFYSRVMINVQGGGVSLPIVYIREAKNPSSPLSLTAAFDVPRNTTPLVQVLLLTSTYWTDPSGNIVNGDGGSNQGFYYGEALGVAMQSDTQALAINVTNMLLAQGAQGSIAGRLIDSSGTGPTGHVSIKFQPPARADGSLSPAMTVSQTEIHAGWFDFFAFEKLKFDYVYEDGTANQRDLMLDIKTGIDTTPTSLPQNQMFITVPTGFTSLYDAGVEVQRNPWSGGKYYLGFFGAGAPTTNKVCYDTTAGATLSGLYTSSTVGSTAQVTWGGATQDATHAGVNVGGIGATGGNCDTTANYYSTWLKVFPIMLRNQHVVLGNHGPFHMFLGSSGSPTLLDTVFDGVSNVTLKWAYLPGVNLDGVDVFTRTIAATSSTNNGQRDYELDDGIDCANLTNTTNPLPNGAFTKAGTVTFASAPTFNVTVDPNAYSSNLVQIVVCPVVSSKYYNLAIDNGMGGGSGGGMTFKQLVASGPLNLTSGSTCGAYTITYNVNNAAMTPATQMTVNLYDNFMGNVPGLSGSFYSSSSCTGTPITSVAIPTTATSATVYYKNATAGFYSIMGQDANSADGVYWQQQPVAVGSAATPSSLNLNIMANINWPPSGSAVPLVQGQCYGPVQLTLVSGTMVPSNNAAQTVTISDSGGGTFYSDSACTTTLAGGSVSYLSTEYQKLVYYKTSATGTGNFTLMSSPLTMPTFMYSLAAPTVTGYAVRTFNGNSPWIAGGTNCQPVSVMALASNLAYTNVASNTPVTVTSPNSTLVFSSSPSCAGAGASISGTISAGMNQTQQFYMQQATGAGITLSATASDGTNSGSSTFYQQPTSLAIAGLPTQNQLMMNFCQPLVAQALWNGATAPAPAAIPLNISTATGGGLALYTDSGCVTALPSSQTIAVATTSQLPFYVKASSMGGTLNLGLQNTPLMTSAALNTVAAPTITLTHSPSGTMTANTCVGVMVSLATAAPAPINFTMSITNSSNLSTSLYSDSACTTAVASPGLTLAAGSLSSIPIAYVKFSTITVATAPVITVSVPQLGQSLTAGPTSCTVSTSCAW